jgi:pimeloyl-ACP methyl ester carboxylesterase
VHHDDSVHSTVQVARDLRKDYPSNVHIETFENHRVTDAHGLIMLLLGAARTGGITDEQKRSARIILYGHSWGASAAVALARTLQKDGIPVLLTIQVDSVSRSGQNDAVIPDNVRLAANFYQDQGFVHGQQKIQAADASRTQILGNFRMDYTDNPVSCPKYPWYTRVFMRSHIEIECDQHVWQRVEELIREQLPTSTAASARTGTP